ncbi:hypothetical protein Patl1_03704 [Pistacia atlantica]|uniref:Uncharacterized protein n=1 Tax=Pistacia atlantica TaxID=434234 RepID=A0ACC1BQK0_9ROSI|nr:hypothetical protein Patl1_03704 [Pistacia atlantica]
MAEKKDAHVVEIPVDEEHQNKVLYCMKTITAIQHHPLMEISRIPSHLLLLKLWQRDEDLFGWRIALKESRMDSIRREMLSFTGTGKYGGNCRKRGVTIELSLGVFRN